MRRWLKGSAADWPATYTIPYEQRQANTTRGTKHEYQEVRARSSLGSLTERETTKYSPVHKDLDKICITPYACSALYCGLRKRRYSVYCDLVKQSHQRQTPSISTSIRP